MMRAELHNPQAVILDEISRPEFTRDHVAQTYAFCIRQRMTDPVDFGAINRAIMERWSKSALAYIKRKAWAMVLEHAD